LLETNEPKTLVRQGAQRRITKDGVYGGTAKPLLSMPQYEAWHSLRKKLKFHVQMCANTILDLNSLFRHFSCNMHPPKNKEKWGLSTVRKVGGRSPIRPASEARVTRVVKKPESILLSPL